MGNVKININGETFDVHYEGKLAIAIGRKDKKEYKGSSVYDLIDKIKKSNA